MCIETMNLATALLPKFAFDIGYDATLLNLLSSYQKNPGTETYQAVQQFLLEKRKEQQAVMNTFSKNKRLNLNILDYEDNLLWSTAKLEIQDKIVLLYQASEYSSQSTQGSAYKKFEDGSEFNLSWVSGGPIFAKGGALKFGTNTSNTATVTSSGATVSTSGDYTVYTFNDSGSISFSNISGSIPLNILAVGGGGGAGGGGGGGAGGFVEQTIDATETITITIGSGGAGSGPTSLTAQGTNGVNTTVTGIPAALGGGGGGSYGGDGPSYGGDGFNGGSGGGAGCGGSPGLGLQTGGYAYDGGTAPSDCGGFGGGGGGAGGVGGNTYDGIYGGNGGSGRQPTLAGLPTTTYYAGGGGGYTGGTGGQGGGGADGSAGTANTGGGGGVSMAGGSGIVIISILTADIS